MTEAASDTAAPAERTLLGRVAGGLNALGTVWIFVLLLLVNADVGGRFLFGAPLRGVPEIVSMSIVAIVFLQLAHTALRGRLTRSDALIGLLHARAPRLAQALEAAFALLGAACCAVLIWAVVPLLERAIEIEEYVGAIGDFTAPVWPVRLVIILGTALAAMVFLLAAARHLRAMAGRGR